MTSPPWLRLVVALSITFVAQVAVAQTGTATLQGVVTSAADDTPVADVVVTVTSPASLGEQMVVTDSAGFYRIPSLPPGVYELRLEMDAFRPYSRTGIELRADSTIRVNAVMLPETLQAETVVVVGKTPSVDVGSSSVGANVNKELVQRVPLAVPGSKGGASRSFEAVAVVAPGASGDQYGTSLNGTSSPENGYKIDGLSVGNPGFGTLGTPLSSEFVKEVNVVTGGYLPEYGRAQGGILNVVTESGSNEFHGSVFSYYTPGWGAGGTKKISVAGQTLQANQSLNYIGDVGFDLGGPIIKDKLWFYTGFDVARTSYDVKRRFNFCKGDLTVDGECTAGWGNMKDAGKTYEAEATAIQAMAKLTLAVNANNRLTLTGYVTPQWSGDKNQYSIDPATSYAEGLTDAGPGTFGATAHQRRAAGYDVGLKWTSELMNKRLIFDTLVGFHHEYNDTLAADGSGPGDKGLASQPNVSWSRYEDWTDGTPPIYHGIDEFENVSAEDKAKYCDPLMPGNSTRCPVPQYYSGGPGFLHEQKYNRYQGSEVVTYIFEGLGHHVLKAGVDLALDTYDSVKGYSGGQNYEESADGSQFAVNWASSYGVLTGPDNPEYLDPRKTDPMSITWGAFIQDSWSVMDMVTLNLGVRYDEQYLFNSQGDMGLAMPNQWSPRVGAIYDVLQNGTTKLFVNYARYYQSLPLDLADVTLSGEPHVRHTANAGACNLTPGEGYDPAACLADDNVALTGLPHDPNQVYSPNGAGASPVDPNIKPPSSDEIVLGGEYEVIEDTRVGLTYTKRWLNYAVEDMSADYAATYFLGNPGYGIGDGFPKAKRDYDAITLFLTKTFSDTWLAQASYTVAWLRGNYPGLFRPESGDLLPGHGTDFDHYLLVVNRDGPLPGDRRHDIKVFGAKDWNIGKHHAIMNGVSFRAHSGEPTNYLAGDKFYYGDENYVLERGSGKRLPWNYNIDGQIGYRYNIDESKSIGVTVDVFNIFNFQNVVATDQIWTADRVETKERKKSELDEVIDLETDDVISEAALNKNFGRPTAYQAPRIFRFGIRGTF
jgi:outer membrane receptor protein involved in Fe transport